AGGMGTLVGVQPDAQGAGAGGAGRGGHAPAVEFRRGGADPERLPLAVDRGRWGRRRRVGGASVVGGGGDAPRGEPAGACGTTGGETAAEGQAVDQAAGATAGRVGRPGGAGGNPKPPPTEPTPPHPP